MARRPINSSCVFISFFPQQRSWRGTAGIRTRLVREFKSPVCCFKIQGEHNCVIVSVKAVARTKFINRATDVSLKQKIYSEPINIPVSAIKAENLVHKSPIPRSFTGCRWSMANIYFCAHTLRTNFRLFPRNKYPRKSDFKNPFKRP